MYVSVPLKSESISYRGMGDPAQLHWLLSARNEAAFFPVKSYVSQEGKVFDKVFLSALVNQKVENHQNSL